MYAPTRFVPLFSKKCSTSLSSLFPGFGHGYVPSAPLYGIGHGIGHGIAAAPAIPHTYTAPLSQYSHGYNSASLLAAPWRAGYSGLHGAGFGHGVGYINGW